MGANLDHLRDEPPVNSPDGCPRPLMWHLARELFNAHAPGVDGLCWLCRPAELHPCSARRLAASGLRTACGRADEPAGAAWLDVLRHRVRAGDLDPTDVAAEAMWLHQYRDGG